MRERIVQTRRQVASLEAQLEAVRHEAGFLERELASFRALYDERRVELQQLMERERAAARLAGEAGDIGARIAAARSRIAEIELQVLQIGANRVAEAEGEAREAHAREIPGARAPGLGAGRGLRAWRCGRRCPARCSRCGCSHRPKWCSRASRSLKIVPADAALVVRAQLEPIHVDQVWPGQEALILFPGLPARTTPAFEGRVLRVAADASLDAETGLAWYEVEVEMGQAVEPETERTMAAWAGRLRARAADWYAEGAGGWVQRKDWMPDWLREALSGGGGRRSAPGTTAEGARCGCRRGHGRARAGADAGHARGGASAHR